MTPDERAAAVIEATARSLPPCDLNSRMAKNAMVPVLATAIREAVAAAVAEERASCGKLHVIVPGVVTSFAEPSVVAGAARLAALERVLSEASCVIDASNLDECGDMGTSVSTPLPAMARLISEVTALRALDAAKEAT